MHSIIESRPTLEVCRYLHFKECLFKFSRLCKDNREFLQSKLDQVQPQRLFTYSVDGINRPERQVPKRRMWIPRCFNSMQLEINGKVHLMEFMVTMKHFRKDLTLFVNLHNFTDENPGNDKLVELLGYYQIEELRLNGCSLNLRASTMFLLQPPKVLHCLNGFINFQKAQQVINAVDLKIINSRVYCMHSNDRLFSHVKRAVLQNCLIKDSVFKMFSSKLTELILCKKVYDGQSAHTDMLHKLIQDGYQLSKLKLLSVTCMVAEESLLVLLRKMPFPELEVLKIDN